MRVEASTSIGGWRQWRHLTQEVKRWFNKVRIDATSEEPMSDRVEAYHDR